MSGHIDELLASPEVYHIDEDGNTYAIEVLTNTYTTKTRVNDKLFNYTLSFKYTIRDQQQR
jgi:hypothetical protein